jgi:hypothetical protein
MLTGSERSEAASGLDLKPLALISAPNATDSSLIRLFTLAYSSAYAWFGPFWMLVIIRGFIGITHDSAEGNRCPVSSWGVRNPRRSATPHTGILWACIHSDSQIGGAVDAPGNSHLEINELYL